MRLGIMQPYFFPYAGYFDLILKSDEWVVFDVVKFTPKTWMSRNLILEPNKGAQYISVSIDKKTTGVLSETRLSDFSRDAEKIRRQLGIYRKHAPHYGAVVAVVERAFARFEGDLLRDLCVICLQETCAYLDIPFHPRICSELGLDFSRVAQPGDWALEISTQLGADAYVNPPGGVGIFDPAAWDARGVTLSFTEMPNLVYPVGGPFSFRENASVLDCMMWMAPKAIRAHLATRRLNPHPDANSTETPR